MIFGKITLILVYAWAVTALILGDRVPGHFIAWKIALGLIVMHLLEAAVFLKDLKRARGALAWHIIMVALFGVLHYVDVRRELYGSAEE